MSYEGENRRAESPESIHLDKRLTWGIVSTVVLVLLLLNNYTAGLKYQQAQDKRISILEAELTGEQATWIFTKSRDITMHAHLDSEMHKLKLAQDSTISIIRAVETCAKNV